MGVEKYVPPALAPVRDRDRPVENATDGRLDTYPAPDGRLDERDEPLVRRFLEARAEPPLTLAEAKERELEARKRLRAVSNPPDGWAYHEAVSRFRDAVRATIIAEDEE